VQSIGWSPFIGELAICCGIVFLTADIVWIGLIGRFFQPFLRAVVFHSMRMMSSWGSWHMVASVSQLIQGWSSMKDLNVDVLDVMTSKSSTLPYDDEIMKRMIGLVQKAKSTPV
jgi:hypothetical protein